MFPRFKFLVPALASIWLMCPEAALAQRVAPTPFPGPLELTEPVSRVKEPDDVYIVQLRSDGAASYKGGTTGFAATKPLLGERFDSSAPDVRSYVQYLEANHDEILASIGGGQKVYSYRYAFNGFATRLTPDEVSRLARHPQVAGIWRDTIHELQTNNASLFLGLLDQQGGLRADLGLSGEDVVIGVIDSGVDPTHPALRDYEEDVPRACRSEWAEGSWLGTFLCWSVLRNPDEIPTYEPPAGFTGICQEGDRFPPSSCNNKLIGARYYLDGFVSRYPMDDNEFISPKDADGHGTHIATIVAGNPVTASLFGSRIGEISGIAPRARVAVYKACWLKPGDDRASCATSDLARAIDDAVGDGVDIINYSVGSLETDLTAPEDIALLNAVDAGVLSVVAAGNDGPENFTIGSPSSAPWVLTVAAGTQTGTRYEQAIEVTQPEQLASLLLMREASFTRQLADSDPVEGPLVLVDDGEIVLGVNGQGSYYDACEPLENADEIDGNIALIERGGCTFQLKIQRVRDAGAIGAVVYNTTGDPIVMNGDGGTIDIPAVMIGTGDGDWLVDAIFDGEEPEVRLAYGVLGQIQDTGNRVTDFSSRGPALSESDFVKPDITAPGKNILAGSTPDIANGTRGEIYQYLSGTSMATPMVAGIAALLKEARPDWSPGTLKSALMTTASAGLVTEDGEFVANPFDVGTGHVDANAALNPGLVYDTRYSDYAAYLCGTDKPVLAQASCDALAEAGFPFAPEQLNLPSVGVTELIPGDVIVRTVTNVGPAAVYQASIEAPPGLSVSVDPQSLVLSAGESAQYRLTLDVIDAEFDFWQFGNVNWSDGTHEMNTPIAAQPVYLRAPRDIRLTGLSGTDTMPVDFGYGGDYFAGVHGLHPPGMRESGFVDDDPSNSFSFRFTNGVTGHYFAVPPDELFLRVALFDSLTDGQDDLDLYVYYCGALLSCTEVGKSGSFTSEEEVDVLLPQPGLYAALVHGFQTDEVNGGPGANYEIMAWSFGRDDAEGNIAIEAPDLVSRGDRLDFDYEWGPLDEDTPYLGAFSHDTPFDVFFLTIVTANMP